LRERKFTASFTDQGYCFNAGEWTFPDAPLRGVFGRNDVYASATGVEQLRALVEQNRMLSRAFALVVGCN